MADNNTVDTQERKEERRLNRKGSIHLKSVPFWKDNTGTITLSAFGEKPKTSITAQSVRKEFEKDVLRAINLGYLVQVTSEKELEALKMDSAEKKERPGLFKIDKSDVRLKYNDTDSAEVKSGERNAKAPSIEDGTLKYQGSIPRAFEILQENNNDLIEKSITSAVSVMGESDAIAFLDELMSIEKNGYNYHYGPRTQVMDVIRNVGINMGFKVGIASVEEIPDPDLEDSVARFTL